MGDGVSALLEFKFSLLPFPAVHADNSIVKISKKNNISFFINRFSLRILIMDILATAALNAGDNPCNNA